MVQPNLKERAAQLEKDLKVSIYQFEIGGLTFLFRSLTLEELSLTSGEYDPTELEDFYVSTVTLYPEEFDIGKVKAGYITRYADQILHASGFDDPNVITDLLDRHRQAANSRNIILSMKAFILSVMPAYKSEDLDQLTMEQLIEKLVLAEKLIGIQQGAAGLQPDGFKLSFSDPDAEPAEEAKPKKKMKGVNPLVDGVFIDPKPKDKNAAPPKKPAMNDEEYLKQKKKLIQHIASTNMQNASVENRVAVDYSALEAMTIDQLQTLAGITKADDPIARKLAANQGRQRNVARSVGLNFDD